ncbi:hypothetical protein Sj15T_09850 [Sphingobium sp. TA15]|nr:hypothetical protein [Sphingobium indicum]BDD65964.1 hypothetical protein Sj15T_09850 [Sphingobium sp. TA15]
MNPFDHARSSVSIHGGVTEDYQAVHDWLDASKATQCHFTHRALRHHVEGIGLAAELFGPTILNADGVTVPTDAIARQHVEEDCYGVISAADWLDDFQVPDWLPLSVPSADELADWSARRFGGSPSAYQPLHAWLLQTQDWVSDTRHLVFRHQAFGIFEAEGRFGHAIRQGTRTVPTRVVAEQHVRTVIGRIPAATDFLRRIKGQRWMLQAASPASLGLD